MIILSDAIMRGPLIQCADLNGVERLAEVRKSGILNISEFLIVLVETAELEHTKSST